MMKLKQRQRLTMKTVFLISASSVFLAVLTTFYFSAFFEAKQASANNVGDFRSATSGNWDSFSTWEIYDGANWIQATSAPNASSGKIFIDQGHTVTVIANATADEIYIGQGATLSILVGKSLTVANATGDDVIVKGTIVINGTLQLNAGSNMLVAGLVSLESTGSGNFNGNSQVSIIENGRFHRKSKNLSTGTGIWTVNSGGIYQHDVNGEDIIEATWNTGSLCEITGITANKPSKMDQPFYSWTYNCPNQTATLDFGGKLTAIDGDLTFISTGTGRVRLGQDDNYSMTVAGSFYQMGGTVFANTKSTSCIMTIRKNFVVSGGLFGGTDGTKDDGEGSPTINVEGNFIMSSGTVDLNQFTKNETSNKGITTLNLYGDILQTGGTITETGLGRGEIRFVKPGYQEFEKSTGNIENTINYTVVNGTTLDLNNNIVTSAGGFTLSGGAHLVIGSPDGITTSGSVGNVQVAGTRSYNTGADYTYNGSAAQVTGNGLPSTVRNLTINNNLGVTLTSSVSASGTLNFTSGNVITGSQTLTLGTSTSNRGSLLRTSGHVVGNMARWFNNAVVSNVEFPVGFGSLYMGMSLSYTSAPSAGGTITASYSAVHPGVLGIPLTDGSVTVENVGFGLWSAAAGNGLTGGTFSLSLISTGLQGVSDLTTLTLLRRSGSGTAWSSSGTHAAGAGTSAAPVANRTGMTSLGQFGIGSRTPNVLPIKLINFNASLKNGVVNLTWATASEINNDFFTIERSSNGEDFEGLFTRPGAGNSTYRIEYSAADEEPLSGYSYYRLKQTDFDGKYSYSDVRTIKNKGSEDKSAELEIISSMPNPFTDHFRLNFKVMQRTTLDFMIINSSGKIVAQDKIETTEGYNIYDYTDHANLVKGVYIVYLSNGNMKASYKVVKGS